MMGNPPALDPENTNDSIRVVIYSVHLQEVALESFLDLWYLGK